MPRVAASLRSLLERGGAPWPGTITHFAQLGSTNDHLKALAAELPAWSVVQAEHQSAGRGRTGRSWESLAGNLHLSVLLHCTPRDPRLPLLSLAAGVVVAEAIDVLTSHAVRLKWPNDIVGRDGKLGGILCEGLAAAGGDIGAVVVGIGLNVTHAPDPAVVEGASCLESETGRALERERLAAEVLLRLRLWYDARPDEAVAIVERWRARAVDWWGNEVEVLSPEGSLRGIARQVDERGALVIELPDGRCRTLISGEVRQLRAVAGADGAGR